MKNVGIITVYHTENCGSVLQAKCLSDMLSELNCNVSFISTKNSLSGHSKKRLFKNCIKKIIKRESFISTIKKYNSYSRFIRNNFNIINYNKIEKLQSVYFGSDTIWDINSEYFLKSQDIFWGLNINNIDMFSYAASIANSSYSDLDGLEYPIKQLKKFKKMSARDRYTQNYLSTRTNQKVDIVCDPTLLFDSQYYVKYLKKTKNSKKYLLLYLFNEPSSAVKKQIMDYAKTHEMRIVCLIGIGKLISFADEYVESTVENFISYFYNANCIITNTFHGTIFSLIFNKNFVTLDYNKIKINELLKQFDLTERLTLNNISKKLDEKINYEGVNKKINNLREKSINYLKETINNEKKC